MKLSKIILALALPVLALISAGCQEEEESMSKAILLSESSVELPPIASQLPMTVYADAEWAADVTDTWLTVDTNHGDKTQDIVVSVAENPGAEPRTAKLVVKGSTFAGTIECTITQKGNMYGGVSSYKVSELASVEDSSYVVVPGLEIVAVGKKGFIATDGSDFVHVIGEPVYYENGSQAADVPGKVVDIQGQAVKENGLSAILQDNAYFSKDAEASEPEAKDITEEAASYAPSKVEYVALSGSYSGGVITVGDKAVATVDDPSSVKGLEDMELRNLDLKGYCIGKGDNLVIFPVSYEDKGAAAKILAVFNVGDAEMKQQSATFAATSKITAAVGSAYLQYVPNNLSATDPNKKYKLDVSGNDPRVTGPFIGDYFLFVINTPIKGNSELGVKFGARTSATGPKYWIAEYLDGKTWKPLCETKTTDEMPGVPYTHQTNADGGTNVIVEGDVTVEESMMNFQVRFRCLTTISANGGKLTARNGGSARISVKSGGSAETPVTAPKPTFMLLKEGDGPEPVPPVQANISTDVPYIAFEGTPDGPKTVEITSDQDFTLSADAAWFSVDTTSGKAGKPLKVNVTAEPSTLSTMRESKITVTAGITTYTIPVLQSAAGQTLHPFISIANGNSMEVSGKAGSGSFTVQSNVDYETEVLDGSWLHLAPATKALVSDTDVNFTYDAIPADLDERTARIRVYNDANKVESILMVKQTSGTTYFKDDFEWLSGWSESLGAEDAVGTNNPSASAPNIASTSAELVDVLTKDHGYSFIYGQKGKEWTADGLRDAKVVYLQKNYLKFGKSKYNAGITLPALSGISGEAKVVLSFDWCWQLTGKMQPDYMTLSVDAKEGTFANGKTTSDKIESTLPTDGDKSTMKWMHAEVELTVRNDAVITIRPTEYNPYVENEKRGQNRWYIDNIKVKGVE